MDQGLVKVSFGKGEKVVNRGPDGFYATHEFNYSLEEIVPKAQVKEKSLEMRLDVARFIANSKVASGVKTPEEVMPEITTLQSALDEWRSKNVKKEG